MKKLLFIFASFISISLFANVNYNVFLKLDQNVETQVDKISKEFKKLGIESLKAQGHVVHLTLYLTEYKEESLNDIKKIVDEISSKTEKFDIDFVKFTRTGGNWFFLDPIKTTKLQALSDEFVARLLPIRAKDAKVPDWAKNIPAKATSFITYGSPNVFSNFDPHITLLTPPKNLDALSKFIQTYKLNPFKGKAIAIGIAKVNDLGQAKESDVLYLKELK